MANKTAEQMEDDRLLGTSSQESEGTGQEEARASDLGKKFPRSQRFFPRRVRKQKAVPFSVFMR
jgi:hypothetical protein